MASNRDITIRIGAKNTASQVIAKLGRDIRKLTGQISNFGRMTGQAFSGAGRSIGGLGKGLLAIGGTAAIGFGMATRTFAAFDSKMAEVEAITKSSGEQMEILRDKAKELGSSTKFSASEAAEGMKFLGMAGFDTNQILAGIGPTLALAAAGGVELGEAADIASDVSTAFGLSANEIGRVADVIATAATSSNTTVLGMSETFKYAAPLAAAAGQSIEETSAAIGLLANSAVKASVAGTDVAGMLKVLGSGDTQEKLKEMGVSVMDAEGGFRPLLDIMTDLKDATSGMAEGEKFTFMTGLFQRYAKSALILTKASGEDIDKLRDKMENSAGAAQRMADTMAGSLGGAGIALKSAFEGLQIAIVEAFEGSLMTATKVLTAFVAGATKWINANEGLVIGIGVLVGSFTILGGALFTLGGIFTLTGFAITGFSAALSLAGGLIAAITGPVIGPLVAILAVAVGVMTVLATSFVMTAYESGLLGDAWDHLKVILGNLLETATKTFEGITNAMKAGEWALAAKIGLAGVRVAFWGGLMDIATAFAMMMPKIWVTVQTFLSNWIEKVKATAGIIARIVANPSLSGVLLAKKAIDSLLSYAPSGNDGGIASFMIGQREAAEKELDDLVKLAAAKASQAKAAVASGGDPNASPASGGTAGGLADLAVNGPSDLMAKAAAMAASLAASLTPAAAGAIAGAPGWTPAYHDPVGKIGVTTVSGGPKAFGEADALQATEGRLLSRGSGNNPALAESKQQTKIQEKQLEKLNLISENFTNTPNPQDGIDFQFSGMV